MTPQERLGKRLFLILATLMVLGQFGGFGRGLFGYRAELHWLMLLSLILSFPFLWRGYARLRWLVGGVCVLSGGLAAFDIGLELADADFYVVDGSDWFLVIIAGILDLVNVLGGLAFWFLPSLQAFFRYQREGRLTGMARADRLSPTLPNQRRSFPQPMAAGGWGLALGCGGGFLAAASFALSVVGFSPEVGLGARAAIVLGGAAAGGLLGLLAGLAVGIVPRKATQSTVRLAVMRGLIAAGACVITLAMVAALWGGLCGFNAGHMGRADPGWEAAALTAGIMVVIWGLPIAVVGFILGGAVALLTRDR